ncbi:MAG: hypothetical protein L6Q38_00405 [Nitrospira sp.]|nr:hypothetical protein [Nitrospira sp.]
MQKQAQVPKPAVGEFATVDGPEDRQIVEIADAQCPGAAPVFDDEACTASKILAQGVVSSTAARASR